MLQGSQMSGPMQLLIGIQETRNNNQKDLHTDGYMKLSNNLGQYDKEG